MTTYLTQRNSNQDFQCDQNKPCSITKSYSSRTIVHPKLEMTEPGDHDEQEADVIANTIAAGGKISRKISGGSGSSGITVSNQMESQLSHLQGGGQAMPTGLRNMMERGFGQDFSHVRLHTDSEAASLSSSIHAKAFTHGNDIYFNQGRFSPNTSEGQKLMAHELTHVVQGGGKIGREDEGGTENKTTPQEIWLLKMFEFPLVLTPETEQLIESLNNQRFNNLDNKDLLELPSPDLQALTNFTIGHWGDYKLNFNLSGLGFQLNNTKSKDSYELKVDPLGKSLTIKGSFDFFYFEVYGRYSNKKDYEFMIKVGLEELIRKWIDKK